MTGENIKIKYCEWCGEPFIKRFSKTSRESNKKFAKRRFCSIPCRLEWQRDWYINDNPIKYFDNSGENNPMYGKYKNDLEGKQRKDGYKRINLNGKRILKHRYLMEENLGRKLKEDEIVHHKDGDNTNNDISNLEVITQSEHCRKHSICGRFANLKEVVLCR